MKLTKRKEEIKIFKSEAAFYSYLDRKLNADGYVLVETSPVLKEEVKIRENYPARIERPEGRD